MPHSIASNCLSRNWQTFSDMFDIIPLGVSSALPTRDRHLSSTVLIRGGESFLFDCGEGTQYQLLHAGLKAYRITAIFITHFHGDHVYGLPGLMASLAMLKRKEPLLLVGPQGLRRLIDFVRDFSSMDWPFEIQVTEVEEGTAYARVWETDEYYVEARPLEHRIFTLGYRFQEKPRRGRIYPERARALGLTDMRLLGLLEEGKAIELPGGRRITPEEVMGPPRPGAAFAYCTDTRPCPSGVLLGRKAELLYHEATFTHDLLERAIETGHSTAREAAEVALKAEAQRLLIGHFSVRYRSVTPLVQEAREIFPCTEAAQELKRYRVGTPDVLPVELKDVCKE